MIAALIFIVRKFFRVGVAYYAMWVTIFLPMWWFGIVIESWSVKWLMGILAMAPIGATAMMLSIEWDDYERERRYIQQSIERLKVARLERKQLNAQPPRAGSEPPEVY